MMYDRLVTVFGGSGFLGRYIVKRLADDGWLVRVAVRRPHEALFLKPLGIVGQIQLVAANVRVRESVEAAVQDADAVVNAVGILTPRGRQRFAAVHVTGARHVAEAAARAGASALVHVSALGADPASPSAYARSKAEGEAAVRAAFPEAVIVRPSVIFGAEDDFFNRFAVLAHRLPFMPVIADAVGEIFRRSFGHLADPAPLYELGGPHVESFRDILRKVLSFTGLDRPLIAVPMPIARLLAAVAQFLPGKPFTPDQLTLLARDNVTSGDQPGLRELGITPTPEEAVMPAYMVHFRPEGQFSRGVGGWVSGAVRRAQA